MYGYYSRLLKAKVKMTYARKKLLDELILETSYISADSLHQRCHDIAIATIYRTLDLFETLEIVDSINREKIKLYKIRHPKHNYHIQFVCKVCNQNFQYNDPEMIQAFSIIQSQIDAKFHHMLDDHLILEGICNSCLAKE